MTQDFNEIKKKPESLEERIARVSHMETLCDQIQEELDSKEMGLRRRLLALKPEIQELSAYYDGPVWISDYEVEQRGEFPKDLSRGVLAEDTLYDLLTEVDEIINARTKQYIVDAFTSVPFQGNPAAVCVMDEWPSEDFMMKLAAENNLSETAYIVKEPEGYHLRWFTPGTEVEICGHATLASAFVILNFYDREASEVHFNTLSGELVVRRVGDMLELDFPRYELKEIPVTDAMEAAFGVRPIKAVLGLDLICVFENEEQVRSMVPNQELLMEIEGRIQNATAQGSETDCVSRSFCPKLAIAEDPVCGSAHCQIADFWAGALNKDEIYAYQASARSGYLTCRLLNKDRIAIRGNATLVSIAELQLERI